MAALPRRRKTKKPPKWVLPLVIVIMLITLVGVLALANYLIKKDSENKQTHRTQSHVRQLCAFESLSDSCLL
jgi:hypothetical protein